MRRIFLLLSSLMFSSYSLADCQSFIPQLAKTLHPELTLAPSNLNICKIWPYAPDKTIVVMTLISDIPEQYSDQPTYDVDVLVVDSTTGKLIAHRYDQNAISDDAIYTDNISIDTARYQLTADNRAFGIRTYHRGSSRVNPIADYVLTLYSLQDGKLNKLTKPLQMDQYSAEWDGNCAGEFSEDKRTISVAKTQTHGFNDLQINSVTTSRRSELVKEDNCVDKEVSVRKNSMLLKYNGTEYTVPQKALSFYPF
ncbi:hypothetical protein QVN42_15240 [Yersinia nurmii]|uniref:Lipoprotein n=1 Tax=Yersinia nurmii TaxID=685706 RepID=A0AAW7K7C7_9GAMM|nr:hypothetical protein [Yersinia nurmii]MDN0088709.1 hypothetical protein [Yersinia nurmii]CNE94658.1 Uncharacterised protein [Yersinia nurmii]